MNPPPAPPMVPPADHPAIPPAKIGVLLINLGTPDAPETGAVRRYLKQFLSDPRVVEIPQLLWQPILRGIVLNTRPEKSAAAYREVWSEDGSPLAAITAAQSRALSGRWGDAVRVDWAMRYGNPSIPRAVERMRAAGVTRLLIAPLYPQYCAATTATANDEVFLALRRMRWQPAVRTLPPYYDDPLYIDALAASIGRQLNEAGARGDELLLASFHGMPQRTLELGDPYHCHCRKTARLLSERLGRDVAVAFQSRFGRAKWLEPATDAELERYARAGVKRIALVAPGFSADCLETLEELAIRGREQFTDAGGEEFSYLRCLNADAEGIALLEALIARELAGWI